MLYLTNSRKLVIENCGGCAADSGRVYCCGAKGKRILEFTTFNQNALHLTRVHYANFYQSAFRHEQLKYVTPMNRRPFSRRFQ